MQQFFFFYVYIIIEAFPNYLGGFSSLLAYLWKGGAESLAASLCLSIYFGTERQLLSDI